MAIANRYVEIYRLAESAHPGESIGNTYRLYAAFFGRHPAL